MDHGVEQGAPHQSAPPTEGVPPTPPATPEPVRSGARVGAIDVLRGFAVLGILPMNIMTFAWPFAFYVNPGAIDEVPYEGANRFGYWLVHGLFDLKMMGIFSMLFGVGALLYAQKADRVGSSQTTLLWLRRSAWLLLIGMLHAYLIWEGDILVAYAICAFILVWWVRRLPAWALLAGACVMLLIHFAIAYGMGWLNVNVEQFGEGQRPYFDPTPEEVAEQVDIHQSGYIPIAMNRVVTVLILQLMMIPTYIFWRAGAMMLIGMALYKWRVMTGERSARFYAILALACYGVGLPLVLGGIVYNESTAFDFESFFAGGQMFNMIGAVPVSVGHVALVMLLVRLNVLGLIGRALAAAGRMALTNYLSQSILCALFFYGYGLGMYGHLDRMEQLGVVAAIWMLQLVWSPLWLARFRFGPAEWAWRSLTYWRLQPLRRRAEPGAGGGAGG